MHFARLTGPAEIGQNQRNSIVKAGFVTEVTAGNGDTVHVALEASRTAANSVSGRALRNAGYLENATGHHANAAVVSVRKDHEVEELTHTDSCTGTASRTTCNPNSRAQSLRHAAPPGKTPSLQQTV